LSPEDKNGKEKIGCTLIPCCRPRRTQHARQRVES
jgi:hypothetical protein